MTERNFYRIKDTKGIWYKSFLEIYTISFPVHEQRNSRQQEEAFGDDRYHLVIKTEGELLVSFIAYWDFPDYVYIEHLAVNPDLRGQNKGSELLNDFAAITDKTIILEIDPPVDEMSWKRLSFYERLGYIPNTYTHYHPAYNKANKPHKLLVLSYKEELTEKVYGQFYKDLCNIVMKNSLY